MRNNSRQSRYDEPGLQTVPLLKAGGRRYFQNAPSASPTNGTVSLSIQWPCMEPLPQCFDFADHKVTSMRAILITARYLDPEHVTVPTVMQRALLPLDPTSPAQRSNPLESLDLRLQGDIAHGRLVPYYADVGAVSMRCRPSGS